MVPADCPSHHSWLNYERDAGHAFPFWGQYRDKETDRITTGIGTAIRNQVDSCRKTRSGCTMESAHGSTRPILSTGSIRSVWLKINIKFESHRRMLAIRLERRPAESQGRQKASVIANSEKHGPSWTMDVDQVGSIKTTMYGCRPVREQVRMVDLIGMFKCSVGSMRMSILAGRGVDLWILKSHWFVFYLSGR